MEFCVATPLESLGIPVGTMVDEIWFEKALKKSAMSLVFPVLLIFGGSQTTKMIELVVAPSTLLYPISLLVGC